MSYKNQPQILVETFGPGRFKRHIFDQKWARRIALKFWLKPFDLGGSNAIFLTRNELEELTWIPSRNLSTLAVQMPYFQPEMSSKNLPQYLVEIFRPGRSKHHYFEHDLRSKNPGRNLLTCKLQVAKYLTRIEVKILTSNLDRNLSTWVSKTALYSISILVKILTRIQVESEHHFWHNSKKVCKNS